MSSTWTLDWNTPQPQTTATHCSVTKNGRWVSGFVVTGRLFRRNTIPGLWATDWLNVNYNFWPDINSGSCYYPGLIVRDENNCIGKACRLQTSVVMDIDCWKSKILLINCGPYPGRTKSQHKRKLTQYAMTFAFYIEGVVKLLTCYLNWKLKPTKGKRNNRA